MKKKRKKFDFSQWYFGQDIEDLYSTLKPNFLDTINKLTDNFAESLEIRFETVVKETVAMALEFIANDDLYSFFMFSTRVDKEVNPKGEPVIVFLFGDQDYKISRSLSSFLEMCSDTDLNVIEKYIHAERSKRK